MKTRVFRVLLPLLLNVGCMSNLTELPNPNVQVIGHRGHVSAYPQNTINGVESAVALGADGVELDLVISADRQVVISHEPYMKSSYMLTPQGERINRHREKEYNLYTMSYDSIRKFISGQIPDRKFRDQQQIASYKPLLIALFDSVAAFTKTKNLQPVTYFLEIKSQPSDYEVFQPRPTEFVDLVMKVIKEKNLEDRVVLKSFDANILNALKQKYPEIPVSLLLFKKGISEGLEELQFQPEFIGPYYKQLKDAETVASLQNRGIKVVPWTVNTKKDIHHMFKIGVDGIISDFPERVLKEKEILTRAD